MHGRFVLGTFAVLAAAMAAIVATAEPLPPRLSFTLECEIGKTCYIQKYVDHDASEGYQDYRCGVLSGDKHDGTDIRLVDVAAMNRGAAVLARRLHEHTRNSIESASSFFAAATGRP